MIEILRTKGVGLCIVSFYVDEENGFIICLETEEGIQVLEQVNSAIYLVEAHDIWVKFTGCSSNSFTPCQVKTHLTMAS